MKNLPDAALNALVERTADLIEEPGWRVFAVPSIVTIDGRRSPQVAAAAVVSRRARVRAGSATARAERSAPESLVSTWP